MSGYIEHAADVISLVLGGFHQSDVDRLVSAVAEALAAAGLRIVTAEEEAVLAAVDAYDKVRESWDGTRDGYTQLVDAQTAMLRAIRARRAAETTP